MQETIIAHDMSFGKTSKNGNGRYDFLCKGVIYKLFFQARYSGILSNQKNMEPNGTLIFEQLNACRQERLQVADELQNEVNQTLASVLLWIQFSKKEHNLSEDKFFLQAEINLKTAINQVRMLHYKLSKDI